MSMFDQNDNNERLAVKALDKYGPGGGLGALNQQNMAAQNAIFKLPHTFTGFTGVKVPDNAPSNAVSDGYADGGIIKGPGTGTSDSIASKEPIGGAIIPADVVKLYGKAYFDKLEAAAPKTKADKGKVDAKVSNGEFRLSPEAVKYWGEEAINKLIGSDNESTEQAGQPDETEAPKLGLQGYAQGGVVNPAWGTSTPVPPVPGGYNPHPTPAAAPAPTLGQKLLGTGSGPSPFETLTNALSGKPGYAEGGIVDPRQSTQDFWRNAPQNPVPTPGRANPANPADMMKARLATSGLAQQAQTQALRQQMPNLSARPVAPQPSLAPPISNVAPPVSNVSVAPRLGLAANSVDAGTVGNVAHDLVSNYDYQHPEYKAGLQAMFPKPPGYAEGGVVRKGTQPEDPETYVPQTTTGFPGISDDYVEARSHGLNRVASGAYAAGNQLLPAVKSVANVAKEVGGDVLGLGPNPYLKQPPSLAQSGQGNPQYTPEQQRVADVTAAHANDPYRAPTDAEYIKANYKLGNDGGLASKTGQTYPQDAAIFASPENTAKARELINPPRLGANQAMQQPATNAPGLANTQAGPTPNLGATEQNPIGADGWRNVNGVKVLPWGESLEGNIQKRYDSNTKNGLENAKIAQDRYNTDATVGQRSTEATNVNQLGRDGLTQQAKLEQAKLDAPEYGIVPGQEEAANPKTYQKKGKPVDTSTIDSQYEDEMNKLDPKDPNHDAKHIALTKQWLTLKQQKRQGQ